MINPNTAIILMRSELLLLLIRAYCKALRLFQHLLLSQDSMRHNAPNAGLT
jgi:hypothetical protein